jgi:glycosyltransferase involved in cell wall biosynthesis
VSGRVAILLSTFNGAAYLAEQLESFVAQDCSEWTVFWRDDGSADATVAIMAAFSERVGPDRCIRLDTQAGRLGVLDSYMTLLRAVRPTLTPGDAAAFADQDDVWLPGKLTRGMAALRSAPAATPVLYCSRQILVDAALRRVGVSPPFTRPPGFPAALAQNVATGCTVLLNHAAAALVAASRPPPGTVHDWWSYLLIAACGGRIIADDEPTILYRQHGGNAIGARASKPLRAVAALRRGPGPFMADFSGHLAALADHAGLTIEARRQVDDLRRALAGGPLRRMAALRLPGLRRRHWTEGLLFRLWFLLG